MGVRITLVVALLASLGVSPAGAAQEEPPGTGVNGLSTPQLLERAVALGRLSRTTADLYLAHALRDHRRVPGRFLSDVPWDGTIPLLLLRERLARMPSGPSRREISEALGPSTCDSSPPEPDAEDTTHFHIHYNDMDIESSLTIDDYV
ncbi:MAG TPA: hypothetical protein VE962_07500, partial [Actinomycetota bacterium]|nr:hypothetical protein [Actinomycetota bacterium]